VFIFRRWKPIGLFTVLSAVLAAVASFFITPEFETTSIIYPTESTSFAKSIITDLSNRDFLEFGDEEEVEKMLQVLSSNRIRNKIIEKYNLAEHYEIDPQDKYAKTKVKETYNEKVNISRTKYLSIEITVKDENPQMAADIANSIVTLIDSVIFDIKSERALLALELLEDQYAKKVAELEVVKDSMKSLHELGYNNFNALAERYSEAYAKALASGNRRGADLVKNELQKLSKYANTFNNLNQTQTIITGRLRYLKRKIEELEIAVNADIPNKYVVEKAEVPEKKAYPIRSLIVLIATFASFIFITLLLMIINYSRKPE
jgi:uncharacterized protein involved in exopolysaccharide biosynthesis